MVETQETVIKLTEAYAAFAVYHGHQLAYRQQGRIDHAVGEKSRQHAAGKDLYFICVKRYPLGVDFHARPLHSVNLHSHVDLFRSLCDAALKIFSRRAIWCSRRAFLQFQIRNHDLVEKSQTGSPVHIDQEV